MKLIGSSRSWMSLRTIASSESHGVSDFTDCVGRLHIGIRRTGLIDAWPRAIAHEKNRDNRFMFVADARVAQLVCRARLVDPLHDRRELDVGKLLAIEFGPR